MGGTAEVESEEKLWDLAPRTRYPVKLAQALCEVYFYATEECKEEDQVDFHNLSIGGGFGRSFVNNPHRGQDSESRNFMRVYNRSTGVIQAVAVGADEARFGGIVVSPAD